MLILANKLLGKSSLLASPKLLQAARLGAWRKKNFFMLQTPAEQSLLRKQKIIEGRGRRKSLFTLFKNTKSCRNKPPRGRFVTTPARPGCDGMKDWKAETEGEC